MPIREEEVSQKRRVGERLDDAVHEACVSKVDEPSQTWEGGRQASGGDPSTDLQVPLNPMESQRSLYICVSILFLFSHSRRKKKKYNAVLIFTPLFHKLH